MIRRLSPAALITCAALFFSLGGAAVATTGYLDASPNAAPFTPGGTITSAPVATVPYAVPPPGSHPAPFVPGGTITSAPIQAVPYPAPPLDSHPSYPAPFTPGGTITSAPAATLPYPTPDGSHPVLPRHRARHHGRTYRTRSKTFT